MRADGALSLVLDSRFSDSSPYGKATHCDLCVASLLQIVFAGATRVRCHPKRGSQVFLASPFGVANELIS